MKRLAAIAALATGIYGCGGGGGGLTASATVTGSVGGTPFAAKGAFTGVTTVHARGYTVSADTVQITTVAGACTAAGAHQLSAGSATLSMSLVSQMSFSTATGTYTVYDSSSGGMPTGNFVNVIYTSLGASCVPSTYATGASGTVTVSSASGAGVAGSFDLTLSTGDHLTGSFSAPNCGAFDQNINFGPDGGITLPDAGTYTCH